MLLEHELWLYASRNDAARAHFAARFAEARRRVVESTASWPDDGRSELPGTPDQVASLLVALLVGLEMQHRVDPGAVTDETAVLGLRAVTGLRADDRPSRPTEHDRPEHDRPGHDRSHPEHDHSGPGHHRTRQHPEAPHHVTYRKSRHPPPHVPHEENVVNIDDIDLLAETWGQRVPHEEFDLLRAEDPVHWHPEPNDTGFWAVTRHADVVTVSRDNETYSTELGVAVRRRPRTTRRWPRSASSILDMDGAQAPPLPPPREQGLHAPGDRPAGGADRRAGRGHHGQGLRAGRVRVRRGGRRPAAAADDLRHDRPRPRATGTACSSSATSSSGFDDPDFVTTPEDDAATRRWRSTRYCDAIANDRRANPQDDLMTALVQAEIDGDRLDDLELNLFFVTLVVAGNETTRNLITHGTLALIEHPEQAKLLRAEPEHYPTAVDEMLRWGSSIHNFRRTATKDTVLGGQEIKAGDKVVIYYLAANYDPDVFDDPHTFDVTRSPNDHVAFGGGGIHYCLGANLARSEIKAMIREVVERMPDLELAGEPRRLRSDFINGIKSMPVRFTPTPRRP